MSSPGEDRTDRIVYRLMMGSLVVGALVGVAVLGVLFFVIPLLFLSRTHAILVGAGLSLLTILGIRLGWFTKKRYRPPQDDEPNPY